MIFEELKLENFRQFYGEQKLVFSTDGKRNVTVIHGFNGSGKTTVLNAFVWLLYDEVTPDFEHPDFLINEARFAELAPGGSARVSVRLMFRDGDRRYVAERVQTVEKDDAGTLRVRQKGDLTLTYTDETGEYQESRNPQPHVEQLLPPRLYPFFFFNGERIDRLARPDAYDEIEEGVKVLLDLELFDRAIDHMARHAADRLRVEVTDHSGEEGRRVRQERDELVEEHRTVSEKIAQTKKNRDALLSEKEAIDTKLATMPELARLQTERKHREAHHEQLLDSLKEVRRDLARVVSADGYLVLTPGLLQSADEVLAAAHRAGEIPTPLKRQFVSELLERGSCICERELTPETPPHDAVVAWRNRSASEQLEAAATVTKAAIGSLQRRRARALEELDRLQARRTSLLEDRRKTEEELDELSARIGDRDLGEDPVRLESRRRQIENEIEDLGPELYSLKDRLAQIDEAIAGKDREIRQIERADAQGQLAQRRLEAVTNVRNALKEIRSLRYQELRRDLARRLEEVWGGIAVKDYRAELDDGFHLVLTKDIGGVREPVRGASTGEKQVLALAFIGSLVEKAKETYEQRSSDGAMFRGGRYGLIIDSAFGQLEPEYRRDVARWIPSLAPQVIVLVSESQWRQEVEEELRPLIGREWILKVETTKRRPKEITIQGRSYPYVVESLTGHEATVTLEVE